MSWLKIKALDQHPSETDFQGGCFFSSSDWPCRQNCHSLENLALTARDHIDAQVHMGVRPRPRMAFELAPAGLPARPPTLKKAWEAEESL